GPDNGGVGSVVFYSKNDASIPQVLGDYDQILAGTKKIDAAFTMRASVLAVGSGGIVSCFDQAGKMWVGSGTELKRFDAYSMDKSQTELFAQETYVKGQIKALLVDGGYMWVLTDQSVSRIRYQ
ncbi:hypothetical protein K0U00_38125, partial [Paenibacillus sepulcri]|nr:hypothetical protein [Paenibacillus sepulcri]